MKSVLFCIFSLLICCMMLCSLLIACEDDKKPAGPGEQKPEGEMSQAEKVLNQFEKTDYDGKVEFLIAASSSYENRFVIEQFTSDDDLNGNAVHDELFRRDSMIEAYFNIAIVYDDVLDSQMANHVSSSIGAGDDEYSLILATLGGTARTLFNNDYLRNLYDFEDIDLSQPWWNKQSVNNFEVNGKIFMATGAITNRYVYAPYAMLFNTYLIHEFEMESPYDLVDEDRWTMETFTIMIEDTHRDEGNGEVGLEDFYGLAPASDSETAYYFACGGQMVAKQGDELVPVYEEKINYEILQDVMDMYATDDVLKFKNTYDSNATFKDGRAIFHSTALCDITMLSNMNDKYGIVPMPKYDEDQENYISNANRSIPSQGIFESSTGELLLKAKEEFMQINTPRLQGVCSKGGATGDLKDVEILAQSERGNIVVASRDKLKPIAEAKRLLVCYITDAQNSGIKFANAKGSRVVSLGDPKTNVVLLKTGSFEVKIHNKNAAKMKAWAVAANGERYLKFGEKNVKVDGEYITLSVDTDKMQYGPTFYFELNVE